MLNVLNARPYSRPGLSSKALHEAEATMVLGLTTISEHLAQRAGDGPQHLLRPELFPTDHLFRLLIDLISEWRAVYFLSASVD